VVASKPIDSRRGGRGGSIELVASARPGRAPVIAIADCQRVRRRRRWVPDRHDDLAVAEEDRAVRAARFVHRGAPWKM